jgi:hypothetical protein
MPAVGNTKFAIGKVDHQVSQANRFTVRYIFFDNAITNNVNGGLNSVQWGTDFKDRQHSTAAQLVSTMGANLLNEARVQYATRTQSRAPGSQAGSGPAITIERVANFGAPVGGNADSGFGFTEGNFQVLDNFTYLRGDHSYKLGFNANFVNDSRAQTQIQLYTFSSIDNYLLAQSGANPKAYSTFAQFFGDPGYKYKTQMYAFFVQDDWRLTSDFKLLYGLRYDVYTPPDGIADAPLTSSRAFPTDKNNWQPRAGFVWTLGADKKSVLRGSSGLMYDQPLNAIYEQALVNNGTVIRGNVTFSPTTAGAPSFPSVVGAGTLTPSNTAWTVDPDFQIARMWQNSVQFERQLGSTYSASVGFSYTRGDNLPVVTNINLINPTGQLPDGRPVFSPTQNAATRLDPRFNALFSTQAIGESTYKALTMQLARRFSNGIQWDFAYTLGKSEDTAPIPSTLSVQGDAGRSDMTDLDRDKGPNILDQRHTFVGSIVARPEVSVDNPVLHAILNDNQFGVAILLATGIPVNIRSNRELTNDAVASDRPAGVGRNSINLPARKNVDFRYTRGFALRGTSRVEVLAELKNIFNTVQWAGVNSVVQTDALGNPLGPLPASGGDLPATSGYEQRQFQLGFKFLF